MTALCAVAWGQHAVERVRQLFAQALGYPLPQSAGDYGLDRSAVGEAAAEPYVLFLHGTRPGPASTGQRLIGAPWLSTSTAVAWSCACRG